MVMSVGLDMAITIRAVTGSYWDVLENSVGFYSNTSREQLITELTQEQVTRQIKRDIPATIVFLNTPEELKSYINDWEHLGNLHYSQYDMTGGTFGNELHGLQFSNKSFEAQQKDNLIPETPVTWHIQFGYLNKSNEVSGIDLVYEEYTGKWLLSFIQNANNPDPDKRRAQFFYTDSLGELTNPDKKITRSINPRTVKEIIQDSAGSDFVSELIDHLITDEGKINTEFAYWMRTDPHNANIRYIGQARSHYNPIVGYIDYIKKVRQYSRTVKYINSVTKNFNDKDKYGAVLALAQLGEFLEAQNDENYLQNNPEQMRILTEFANRNILDMSVLNVIDSVIDRKDEYEVEDAAEVFNSIEKGLDALKQIMGPDQFKMMRDQSAGFINEKGVMDDIKSFMEKDFIPNTKNRKRLEGLLSDIEAKGLESKNERSRDIILGYVDDARRKMEIYYKSNNKSAAKTEIFQKQMSHNANIVKSFLPTRWHNIIAGWLKAIAHFTVYTVSFGKIDVLAPSTTKKEVQKSASLIAEEMQKLLSKPDGQSEKGSELEADDSEGEGPRIS